MEWPHAEVTHHTRAVDRNEAVLVGHVDLAGVVVTPRGAGERRDAELVDLFGFIGLQGMDLHAGPVDGDRS
jgi:hypothetical protein